MANSEVTNQIKIVNPGNLDAWRGPYATVADACTAILNATVVVSGVTRNLREGKIVDIGTIATGFTPYMWSGGYADANLVKQINVPLKGTFDSLALAIEAVPLAQRKLGDTVGIKENGSVVEYWWKNTLTDSGLIAKSTPNLSYQLNSVYNPDKNIATNLLNGRIHNVTGVYTEDALWVTMGLTPVSQSTTIRRLGNALSTGNSTTAPVGFWDANKAYLGTLPVMIADQSVTVKDVYPTAEYITASSTALAGLQIFLNANIDQKVVTGLVTDLASKGDKSVQDSLVNTSSNVAGITLTGYIAVSNGTYVAQSGYVSSRDFIKIASSTIVRRIGNAKTSSGQVFTPIAFYDVNKVYLGGMSLISADQSVTVASLYPTAVYIKGTSTTALGLQILLKSTIDETQVTGLSVIKAQALKINEFLEPLDYALTPLYGYYDATGLWINTGTSGAWRSTPLTKVKEGQVIEYDGITPSSSVKAVVGFNANKEFVSILLGRLDTQQHQNVTVPAGITYVAGSSRQNGTDVFKFIMQVLKVQNDAVAEDIPFFMPRIGYARQAKEMRMNPKGILSKQSGIDTVWNLQYGNEHHLKITPPSTTDVGAILYYRQLNGLLKSAGLCTIKVSNTLVNPATPQYFIHLGDSTVECLSSSGIHGAVANEVSRRFKGVGTNILPDASAPTALALSNINFIGTLGDQVVKHEGRGGWATNNYLNDALVGGYTNAFFNPATSKFDLGYYLTQNGFTGVDSTGSNLTLIIGLGWNHYAKNHALTQTEAWLKELLDLIHAQRPGCKVKLTGLPAPPPINEKAFDGERNVSAESVMREAIITYSNLWQKVCDLTAYSGFSEFVPFAPFCFPDNSYPASNVPLSLRDTSTMQVYTDYVHRNARGYAQEADVLFNNIAYNYCR